MKVNQVIVILDACRNDPDSLTMADGPNVLTREFRRGLNLASLKRPISAYLTFYATDVGHRAYIDERTKQGFFAAAIIEALNGAGAIGAVTLHSLLNHVQKAVPVRVAQQRGQLAIQDPVYDLAGYLPLELKLTAPPALPPPSAAAHAGEGRKRDPALASYIAKLENMVENSPTRDLGLYLLNKEVDDVWDKGQGPRNARLTRTISGTLFDRVRAVVAGAAVVAISKADKYGSINGYRVWSDHEGRYSLKCPEEIDEVVIFSGGFKMTIVSPVGPGRLDIVLQEGPTSEKVYVRR